MAAWVEGQPPDAREELVAYLVAVLLLERSELRQHRRLAAVRAENEDLREADAVARWARGEDETHVRFLRDVARQRGVRKPRRTDIDEWLGRQLERTPDATAPELMGRAPDWITDEITSLSAFQKRVTKARRVRRQ